MEAWKEAIKHQLRSDLPALRVGDLVDVHYKVVEGDKERIQVFSGVLMRIRGSDMGKTIMVRKVASGGIGVERIFPLHSPFIAEIKVRRHSQVRRARLYYLRKLKGKAARLKERTILEEIGQSFKEEKLSTEATS